jgi:hypothetical protein
VHGHPLEMLLKKREYLDIARLQDAVILNLYSMVQGQHFYYPVSDLEKTFIDIVYFNIDLRKEII